MISWFSSNFDFISASAQNSSLVVAFCFVHGFVVFAFRMGFGTMAVSLTILTPDGVQSHHTNIVCQIRFNWQLRNMFELDDLFVRELKNHCPGLAEWRDSLSYPLQFALQLPAPFCLQAVHGRWKSVMHPLPSDRFLRSEYFSLIASDNPVVLALSASPATKQTCFSAEPLREVIYALNSGSHAQGSTIMLEGFTII